MQTVKTIIKKTAGAAAFLLIFPAACMALFGRFHDGFLFWAQALALIPGKVGSYLRVAYYSLTLERCGAGSHIAMGSYFSHSRAAVGERVGIGAYCILGRVNLGDGTQLASGVQILSGNAQHSRDPQGRLTDEQRVFRRVEVGPDCWLGAASIIMHNVGAGATVGAGAVVTRDVPAYSTVAGNPARVIHPAQADGPARGATAGSV